MINSTVSAKQTNIASYFQALQKDEKQGSE